MGPLQDRADDEDILVEVTIEDIASMGPLQDRADDPASAKQINVPIDPLQWGRSKTERMTGDITAWRQNIWGLQWGRSKTERMTVLPQPLHAGGCSGFNGAAPRQSG